VRVHADAGADRRRRAFVNDLPRSLRRMNSVGAGVDQLVAPRRLPASAFLRAAQINDRCVLLTRIDEGHL